MSCHVIHQWEGSKYIFTNTSDNYLGTYLKDVKQRAKRAMTNADPQRVCGLYIWVVWLCGYIQCGFWGFGSSGCQKRERAPRKGYICPGGPRGIISWMDTVISTSREEIQIPLLGNIHGSLHEVLRLLRMYLPASTTLDILPARSTQEGMCYITQAGNYKQYIWKLPTSCLRIHFRLLAQVYGVSQHDQMHISVGLQVYPGSRQL